MKSEVHILPPPLASGAHTNSLPVAASLILLLLDLQNLVIHKSHQYNFIQIVSVMLLFLKQLCFSPSPTVSYPIFNGLSSLLFNGLVSAPKNVEYFDPYFGYTRSTIIISCLFSIAILYPEPDVSTNVFEPIPYHLFQAHFNSNQ